MSKIFRIVEGKRGKINAYNTDFKSKKDASFWLKMLKLANKSKKIHAKKTYRIVSGKKSMILKKSRFYKLKNKQGKITHVIPKW